METKPTIVPETANLNGEIREKWKWVEPAVWTERMLAALEKGVKENKWYSLIDKVYSRPKKGGGWGYAKIKWPNKFFADNGLFSLCAAYSQIVNRRKAPH